MKKNTHLRYDIRQRQGTRDFYYLEFDPSGTLIAHCLLEGPRELTEDERAKIDEHNAHVDQYEAQEAEAAAYHQACRDWAERKRTDPELEEPRPAEPEHVTHYANRIPNPGARLGYGGPMPALRPAGYYRQVELGPYSWKHATIPLDEFITPASGIRAFKIAA